LPDLLGHLHGEFARRAEDEHLHGARFGSTRSMAGMAKAAVLPEPVEDWPTTSRPCQDDGNHRGLDGRGFLEAHLVHGLEDLGREAELVETAPAACRPRR
jgi:hypothetical protein